MAEIVKTLIDEDGVIIFIVQPKIKKRPADFPYEYEYEALYSN